MPIHTNSKYEECFRVLRDMDFIVWKGIRVIEDGKTNRIFGL